MKKRNPAAQEMGFPGNPKNNFPFRLNFDIIIGLPGLIATPLKYVLKPNFFISLGIKSNLPAEIALKSQIYQYQSRVISLMLF